MLVIHCSSSRDPGRVPASAFPPKLTQSEAHARGSPVSASLPLPHYTLPQTQGSRVAGSFHAPRSLPGRSVPLPSDLSSQATCSAPGSRSWSSGQRPPGSLLDTESRGPSGEPRVTVFCVCLSPGLHGSDASSPATLRVCAPVCLWPLISPHKQPRGEGSKQGGHCSALNLVSPLHSWAGASLTQVALEAGVCR